MWETLNESNNEWPSVLKITTELGRTQGNYNIKNKPTLESILQYILTVVKKN